MRNFKFLMIALVAMLGFTACEKDCNHYDHSADLVGTWTCLREDFAEALVIKADGSVVSTGYHGTKSWEDLGGNIVVENGNVTLTFEDGNTFKGHFDIIPNMAFSIFKEDGSRLTFNYCANDLSDEVVGMWVCNDSWTDDITVQTYSNDGKSTITTAVGLVTDNSLVNQESEYKVIGDLVFRKIPAEGNFRYLIARIVYTADATEMGDVMTHKMYIPSENGVIENVGSWLRIKQNLDLPGKAYDYNNTYVSNVKGLDEDMTMMGYTFNIGKMEGKNLDKMLKHLLFAVEFPNANTIKYQYHYNGQNLVFEAPIVVDGNKVTIKMSEFSSYYRDVDMYMFQDQDDCQLHMYMPTYAFINYFANMDLAALAFAGEIDLTDEAAVKAIFDRMDERVESINVSFTFKATK
jgi:hypothetical protein